MVLQRKPGAGTSSWKSPTHRINGNLERSESPTTLLPPPPSPSRQYHTEQSPHLGFNSFQEGGLPHPLPPTTKNTPLSSGLLSTCLIVQSSTNSRFLWVNQGPIFKCKKALKGESYCMPSTWRELTEGGLILCGRSHWRCGPRRGGHPQDWRGVKA